MPVHQARETGHSPQVREKPAGKTHQPRGAGEATGGTVTSSPGCPVQGPVKEGSDVGRGIPEPPNSIHFVSCLLHLPVDKKNNVYC